MQAEWSWRDLWWAAPIAMVGGAEIGYVTRPRSTSGSRPSSASGLTPLPLATPLGSGTATNPCDPMTMGCLLDHPVGGLPVPDALAWIPAQRAAVLVWRSGHTIFALSHHPFGYYGASLVPAQEAADYLLRLGIDPCPPLLYAALATASHRTGVPLPILLATAFTESTFLRYGQVANAAEQSGTGATGLMQVTAIATAQVNQSFGLAIPWSNAQTSPATNALVGAYYLRYLATQHGLAYTDPNASAWTPVLQAYGEGNMALLTVSNAGSGAWVDANSPAPVASAQAKRTEATPAPKALQPEAVTCRVVTMRMGSAYTTVKTCSNGTWTQASVLRT